MKNKYKRINSNWSSSLVFLLSFSFLLLLLLLLLFFWHFISPLSSFILSQLVFDMFCDGSRALQACATAKHGHRLLPCSVDPPRTGSAGFTLLRISQGPNCIVRLYKYEQRSIIGYNRSMIVSISNTRRPIISIPMKVARLLSLTTSYYVYIYRLFSSCCR